MCGHPEREAGQVQSGGHATAQDGVQQLFSGWDLGGVGACGERGPAGTGHSVRTLQGNFLAGPKARVHCKPGKRLPGQATQCGTHALAAPKSMPLAAPTAFISSAQPYAGPSLATHGASRLASASQAALMPWHAASAARAGQGRAGRHRVSRHVGAGEAVGTPGRRGTSPQAEAAEG